MASLIIITIFAYLVGALITHLIVPKDYLLAIAFGFLMSASILRPWCIIYSELTLGKRQIWDVPPILLTHGKFIVLIQIVLCCIGVFFLLFTKPLLILWFIIMLVLMFVVNLISPLFAILFSITLGTILIPITLISPKMAELLIWILLGFILGLCIGLIINYMMPYFSDLYSKPLLLAGIFTILGLSWEIGFTTASEAWFTIFSGCLYFTIFLKPLIIAISGLFGFYIIVD